MLEDSTVLGLPTPHTPSTAEDHLGSTSTQHRRQTLSLTYGRFNGKVDDHADSIANSWRRGRKLRGAASAASIEFDSKESICQSSTTPASIRGLVPSIPTQASLLDPELLYMTTHALMSSSTTCERLLIQLIYPVHTRCTLHADQNQSSSCLLFGGGCSFTPFLLVMSFRCCEGAGQQHDDLSAHGFIPMCMTPMLSPSPHRRSNGLQYSNKSTHKPQPT